MAATDDTPMGKVLCSTVLWVNGNAGKAIATICVLTVGIAQLMGRRKRTTSLRVVIGIAILFGAAKLVDMMNAGANPVCSTI